MILIDFGLFLNQNGVCSTLSAQNTHLIHTSSIDIHDDIRFVLLERRLAETKLKFIKSHPSKTVPERSLSTLGKEVFIGFYIVRKLIESKKVSDSLVNKKREISKYPIKGTKMNRFMIDYYDRIYDLYDGKKAFIALYNLRHQFIHSYVFAPNIEMDNSSHGTRKFDKNTGDYHIKQE